MKNGNAVIFPILTTERLSLRQLSLADQQDIFALRSDPVVNKYLDRDPTKTIEDAIDFINQVKTTVEKAEAYYWAITSADTNTLLGTICLFNFSYDTKSCEIGYELMTKYQGNGIMYEAIQSVADFVFNTLKLETIMAFTHSENQKSMKLLERCNFIQKTEPDKINPNLVAFSLTQENRHR